MKLKHHNILLILLIFCLTQASQLVASENLTISEANFLTSTQLVTDVLTANPQLEIAQATWQASIARIAQQSSLDDPMLVYSMAPQTISNQQTSYGQRIEISQSFPWPGKLQLRSKIAGYQADSVNQNINSVRLQLSVTARTLFADWYYIHQAIDINKINQSLLKDFRAIAISRYSTGLASQQDALRADVEVALLEHQAIVFERQHRLIRTHINTLLNKSPSSVIAAPLALRKIEVLPELKKLQNYALLNRPELKALTAQFKAAKTQSELVESNIYPDIKLKAGYNSLWENQDKHFTIGIGINLPFYLDKQHAAENEALAQIKQTEWEQLDFIAKIRSEIQIAYDLTEESIHVHRLYENKLIPLAKQNLQAATADYQSGKGDFLTLISSEKNWMQTQLQAQQTLTDTHKRMAKLESTVGNIKSLSLIPVTSDTP